MTFFRDGEPNTATAVKVGNIPRREQSLVAGKLVLLSVASSPVAFNAIGRHEEASCSWRGRLSKVQSNVRLRMPQTMCTTLAKLSKIRRVHWWAPVAVGAITTNFSLNMVEVGFAPAKALVWPGTAAADWLGYGSHDLEGFLLYWLGNMVVHCALIAAVYWAVIRVLDRRGSRRQSTNSPPT
jgi:hypothetical protein